MAARRYVTAAAFIAFAFLLASCSQSPGGASGTATSVTFDGAPIDQARQVIEPPQNRIAYSDASLKGWRSIATDAPFTPVRAGAPTPAKLSLTGNGHAVAGTTLSPVIAVTPGQTYTASAWIDARSVTSGYPVLWISNDAGNRIYHSSKILQRQPGRYGFDVTIPDNVSKITLGFYANGSVLTKGATLLFSQPLLVLQPQR